MKNNDALKKNHFWILAGLAPLLTLIAVVMLMSNAGGAAEAALEEQKKKNDELRGVNPSGTLAAEQLEKQKADLLVQREKLWEVNWKAQEPFFVWPGNNQLLKEMQKRYPKFGTPMEARNSEFEIFRNRENYEAAYEQMAKSILPTTFRGGRWQAVLRHVSNWGNRIPTSNQIWLALEDIWVQRGLLQPIRTVNDNVEQFELVNPEKAKAADPTVPRTFRSRIWEIELAVGETTEGPKKPILKAKLKNLTDRLQLLGVQNRMKLLVQLSPNAAPMLYRIEGEFVKAGETLVVKPNPILHAIPVGTEIREIVSVQLRNDQKTSPIRRVESIDLGLKDARHFPASLKNPEFWPEPEGVVPDPAAGGPMGGGDMPPGVVDGGGGAPAGGPYGAARTVVGAKTGTPEAVLNGNRKRYIVETEQVRRMPVCVVLLVDQLFVQDVLTAYANSSLRFQITQYHWKRYRGTGAAGGESGYSGSMEAGSVLGSDGSSDMGGGYVDPLSSGGPESFSDPMMGGGYPGGYPSGADAIITLPSSGSYSPFGQQAASSLAEGQDTSGLVELTLYGIVTLYKNYEKKAEGTEGTDTPKPETTDAEAGGTDGMAPAAPDDKTKSPAPDADADRTKTPAPAAKQAPPPMN